MAATEVRATAITNSSHSRMRTRAESRLRPRSAVVPVASVIPVGAVVRGPWPWSSSSSSSSVGPSVTGGGDTTSSLGVGPGRVADGVGAGDPLSSSTRGHLRRFGAVGEREAGRGDAQGDQYDGGEGRHPASEGHDSTLCPVPEALDEAPMKNSSSSAAVRGRVGSGGAAAPREGGQLSRPMANAASRSCWE